MKYYGKEWYKNGCIIPKEKSQEYADYVNRYLPKWYNDISIHDSEVIGMIKDKNLITLILQYDDYKRTNYKILLYNPEIIENCRIVGCWCISDEIYINDDCCEFHLMVSCEETEQVLKYFTVKCSKIEMQMNGKFYNIESKNQAGIGRS